MSISGTNEATQSVPFGGAPAVIPFTGSSAAGSASTPSRSDHTHGYDPPACRVYHNTTQNLVNNTETTIDYNTESFDNDTLHGATTTRVTINTAGVYLVTWGMRVAADNDYLWGYSYARLNGTTLIITGSSWGTQTDNALAPHLVGSGTYKFAATDFIEIRAAQKNTSGGTNAIQANDCYLTVTWIGEG